MLQVTGPRAYDQAQALLIAQLTRAPATLLVTGPSGSGKSTQITALAAALTTAGRRCFYLSADIGAPAFGVPAAVNLGHWEKGRWQLDAFEALCSLNAARFRLPLLAAVSRLKPNAGDACLLIEAPGLAEGVAAAELLPALCDGLTPDLVVTFANTRQGGPLAAEYASLELPVLPVLSAPKARTLQRGERREHRTRLWNRYLENSVIQALDLRQLLLLGTPPPSGCSAWEHALVALSDGQRTLTMGEVESVDAHSLHLRCPALEVKPTQLIIRDAIRDTKRHLVSRPVAAAATPASPSLVFPTGNKQLVRSQQIKTREVVAELANGTFEDPLLVLALRQSRRCLLFDLGDTARVPLKLLHRATDIFISHAHIDHIGGFMGLLRARLGAPGLSRLYGPPGLVGHVAGYLNGVLWDRIGSDGPCFEVTEVSGSRLSRYRLHAGLGRPRLLDIRDAEDGILLREPGFQVRCTGLDHRTPVLAYAFEPYARFQVDGAALKSLDWPPGPWIAELKRAEKQARPDQLIRLPDGQTLAAHQLSEQLLLRQPGDKLVYATDLADTEDNRRRLVAFAAGAQVLFCEACFARSDRARAQRHGHLTTTACGEIAAQAGVERLVPFHFSRRYEGQSAQLYREIEEAFSPQAGITAISAS